MIAPWFAAQIVIPPDLAKNWEYPSIFCRSANRFQFAAKLLGPAILHNQSREAISARHLFQLCKGHTPPTARLYHYFRSHSNAGAARRVLIEYCAAKDFRQEGWTPTELETLAQLFARLQDLNLLVATRDDLIGRALTLMSGGSDPAVASERWYHESTAAAAAPGELRLVMNLDSLVKSDHFRSYWIQRNVSSVREYWAGVADVTRSPAAITETRLFLRNSEAPAPSAVLSTLASLVPPDACLYRVSPRPAPSALAAAIVSKLIASPAQQSLDYRFAPEAATLDARAGSEADLETRIDEPPLPPDNSQAAAIASLEARL